MVEILFFQPLTSFSVVRKYFASVQNQHSLIIAFHLIKIWLSTKNKIEPPTKQCIYELIKKNKNKKVVNIICLIRSSGTWSRFRFVQDKADLLKIFFSKYKWTKKSKCSFVYCFLISTNFMRVYVEVYLLILSSHSFCSIRLHTINLFGLYIIQKLIKTKQKLLSWLLGPKKQ